MADNNRARHAFGNLADVQAALDAGKIDAYDILFLDGDTEPKVGWIDKNGIFRLVENEADLSAIETQLATKISADEVDVKISNALENLDVDVEVENDYEVSFKPDGTLVDYRDKEIRILIPSDTQFELQTSGEGADANSYYIGVKAYAPSDDVVSFKEDIAEIISDNEMYYFEDNEFAGIDADGRKYSIIWLPVAVNTDGIWIYHGKKSNKEHYVGWHYSVRWYDVDGKVVASDCIRINLSNEDCHSSIEPYYVGEMMTEIAKDIDSKIEEKIAEVGSAYEIVEF